MLTQAVVILPEHTPNTAHSKVDGDGDDDGDGDGDVDDDDGDDDDDDDECSPKLLSSSLNTLPIQHTAKSIMMMMMIVMMVMMLIA